MRKFLFISVIVFLVVFSVLTLGFDYEIGDHPYYMPAGHGKFGEGHDLALLVSKSLGLLGNNALPLFFNFFFAASVYFMIKPFTKYPEWAFLLAPLTPLASVYAQIFAISFFNLAVGFYFRGKERIAALLFIPIFMAHWWAGVFSFLAFFVFAGYLDSNRGKRDSLNRFLFPVSLIALFFTLAMSHNIDFLFYSPEVITQSWETAGQLTIAGFFVVLSRGFGFFILALWGLYKLYSKDRDFFEMNLMLLIIPIVVALVLPTSDYWNWRLFYFMPFLALTSISFASAFE